MLFSSLVSFGSILLAVGVSATPRPDRTYDYAPRHYQSGSVTCYSQCPPSLGGIALDLTSSTIGGGFGKCSYVFIPISVLVPRGDEDPNSSSSEDPAPISTTDDPTPTSTDDWTPTPTTSSSSTPSPTATTYVCDYDSNGDCTGGGGIGYTCPPKAPSDGCGEGAGTSSTAFRKRTSPGEVYDKTPYQQLIASRQYDPKNAKRAAAVKRVGGRRLGDM